MVYEVLDCYNTVVEVKDQDIKEWICSEMPIRREIVMAMGRSHNEEYLPYLYPALYHEDFNMRREAAQGILNLNGDKGLKELKQKNAVLDMSDLEKVPSEKGILMAMILRIEKGAKGVKEYFLTDEGYEIVKYDSIFCYRSGFPFVEEDVEFLCIALEAFLEYKYSWIKRLSKTDYSSFLYFALEGIWIAGKSANILVNINSKLQDDIYRIIERLMAGKLNSDSKLMIANISMYMDKEHAKGILKLLKYNVKGDAKKKFKKSLKHWEIKEEEL